MFWTKIWVFVITACAAVALLIALVMPRPAERSARQHEANRLQTACKVANILLKDNARTRVMSAGQIGAPDSPLGAILSDAGGDTVPDAAHQRAKQYLMGLKFKKNAHDFIILLNREGRVVAQRGATGDTHGESLRGYYLIDDALNGYQRDDVWLLRGTLYAVAASPVVSRSPMRWVGAVVTGRTVAGPFIAGIKSSLQPSSSEESDAQATDVSFYAAGDMISSTTNAQVHAEILEAVAKKPPKPGECSPPIEVGAGDTRYNVVASGLPGEAGELGGFFTVTSPKNGAASFAGTFGAVTKSDLSFGNFPWIKLVLLFLVIAALGLGVVWWEGDSPSRALAGDAVRLAKGEQDRLDESLHRGQHGSVARSVNVALEKVHRDAKAAKSDLDQLLGPLPGQTPAAAAPAARATVSAQQMFTPPPSEFRFSDQAGAAPGAAAQPPPRRRATSAPIDLPGTTPQQPAAAAKPAATSPSGFGGLDLELPAPPPNVQAAPAQRAKPEAPLQPATNAHVEPEMIALPLSAPLMDDDDDGESIPSLPMAGIDLAPAPSSIQDDILGNTNEPMELLGSDSQPAGGDRMEILGTDSQPAVLSEQPTVVSDQSKALAGEDDETSYYREVFDEFLSLKRKCGEKTDNLTFERFSKKLRSNRDALMAKHNCKSVRFQVYVKDGRAALKASPVR